LELGLTNLRAVLSRLASPIPNAKPLLALAMAAVFVLFGLLAMLHFCLGASGRPTRRVHDTFLFDPSISYSDLTFSVDESLRSDPYFDPHIKARRPGWISNYFPFTYQVLGRCRGWSRQEVIKAFVDSSVGCYLLIALLAGLLYGEGLVGSAGLALFLGVTALASFPFLFAVDRGNLETYVAALCFLSMLFLVKDMAVAGALFLALAIAIKGYPAFLCLVFVGRGRWRSGLLALVLAGVLSLEALFCLGGGAAHNVQGLMNGVRGYLDFSGSGNGMAASADPNDALQIIEILRPRLFSSLLPCIAVLCQVFMECAAAACAVYALWSRAPFHRCLLAATLGMMFIPNLIGDYKLLHLVPVIFFMAVEKKPWSRPDLVAFGTLLLLIVPKQYYFLRPYVSMACLIDPLLLLLLVGTLAWDRPAWRTVWASQA
jgi:hypothetical protein